MSARTAILGWGSLLWEGGADFDRWHDEWRYDGPLLNLEFTRVSKSRMGALTLVIDPKHGSPVTVAWCLSKRADPADTAADLRCREGCSIKHVARLDLPLPQTDLPREQAARVIAAWAQDRRFDSVIWTALEANFESVVQTPFSVSSAVCYLQALPVAAKVKAAEYVWRAPEFAQTPLRKALETEPWFTAMRAG